MPYRPRGFVILFSIDLCILFLVAQQLFALGFSK